MWRQAGRSRPRDASLEEGGEISWRTEREEKEGEEEEGGRSGEWRFEHTSGRSLKLLDDRKLFREGANVLLEGLISWRARQGWR